MLPRAMLAGIGNPLTTRTIRLSAATRRRWAAGDRSLLVRHIIVIAYKVAVFEKLTDHLTHGLQNAPAPIAAWHARGSGLPRSSRINHTSAAACVRSAAKRWTSAGLSSEVEFNARLRKCTDVERK